MLTLRLQVAALTLQQLDRPRIAEAAEVMYARPVETREDVGREELEAYAEIIAIQHGLDVKRFLYTIGCESAGWQNVQSFIKDPTGPNGREDSWGIAQFHHPESDWNMTREQALDPYFAIDHMASAWSEGLKSRWACYNDAYGNSGP